MSGGLTAYGIDAILGGTALPDPLYVQLHTGDPTATATANVAAEDTRKAISLADDPTFADTWSNDAAADWTAVPLTEDISHVTLWDAVTDGNPWAIGDLDPVLSLTSGGNGTIPAEAIRLSFTRYA